jgi:hypothetical protein
MFTHPVKIGHYLASSSFWFLRVDSYGFWYDRDNEFLYHHINMNELCMCSLLRRRASHIGHRQCANPESRAHQPLKHRTIWVVQFRAPSTGPAQYVDKNRWFWLKKPPFYWSEFGYPGSRFSIKVAIQQPWPWT